MALISAPTLTTSGSPAAGGRPSAPLLGCLLRALDRGGLLGAGGYGNESSAPHTAMPATVCPPTTHSAILDPTKGVASQPLSVSR